MTSLIERHRAELEALCRRYKVRRLELFGSAARNEERPGKSDLDFLVDFGELPEGAYTENYFGLLEGLEALFERPVDLVSAAAIRNPYFRESVERSKAVVYAA